jgi:hypothetical protein
LRLTAGKYSGELKGESGRKGSALNDFSGYSLAAANAVKLVEGWVNANHDLLLRLPSPKPVFAAQIAQIEIPEGTKVRVRLEQQLSSATADENQPVILAVADDVLVNDAVAIPHDAVVSGTVVESVGKRHMGRTGKLDFSINTIVLPDGNTIPVRYSLLKDEGGNHAVRTGVATAGIAVLFFPAAPFVLLARGKDAVINKGTIYEVFTDTRYIPEHTSEGGTPPAPSLTTAVVISSDPSGADVEVDGAFVANTPSTIQLTSGQHVIKVTKGKKSWQRTINVLAGSNINLTATLEESP